MLHRIVVPLFAPESVWSEVVALQIHCPVTILSCPTLHEVSPSLPHSFEQCSPVFSLVPT